MIRNRNRGFYLKKQITFEKLCTSTKVICSPLAQDGKHQGCGNP